MTLALSSSSWRSRAVVAAGGPLLAGAILGLRLGPRAVAVMAAALPAIALGVAALTTPALYVGGAVLGARPSLPAVAGAVGRGLHALGLALLGLAPLELLTTATVTEPGVAVAGATLLVLLGVGVSLRRIVGELPRGAAPLRGFALLAAWSLVTLIIGGRLFWEALVAARGGL
jgi:hypothetical protein